VDAVRRVRQWRHNDGRGGSPPIVESMSRRKVARVGRSLFERDTVADFPPLVRLRILLLLATRAPQPGRDHGDDSASPHLIVLPRPSRCVTPFVALALSRVASVGNVERGRLQDAALKVTCPPRSDAMKERGLCSP